jgi:LmbE family N-acetylglucosaminyl deacetylase
MEQVLAIAVHPDDETLGCGGTLLKHKASGDRINWLILTSMSKKYGYDEQLIKKRDQEIANIRSLYNFDRVEKLQFPTTKLDTIPQGEIISKISQVLQTINPDVLYLPFKNDIHSDHRVAFEAAYSCTKSFRYPSIKKVLMMETISETEFAPPFREDIFIPNYFVDITDFMELKLNILEKYNSELGNHPFPRSKKNLKALATFRGATAGCKYAEAFMLLKGIN